MARSDPARRTLRGALEPGPTGAHCCCCSGDCCSDQRVPQGAERSGWSVQSELQSAESDTPLSEEVMQHLNDAPIPIEKPPLEQLIDNAKLSVSGFPIPNAFKFEDHCTF